LASDQARNHRDGIFLQEELLEQMSDDIQTVKTGWSSVQVYTLSAICLLVGVTMGYLYRGSTAPQAPAAVQTQTQAGNPMGGGQAAPPAPTPERMKQMADQQVAPLLEQLKQNPKDSALLTKIATYYLAAQQYDESEKYFQMAVDVKPTADALTKLGNAQYFGGSTDKAIATFNKALAVDPKFANALYNLGMLKWQAQGDVKGAVACWEKLIKTNPNHPQRAQVEKMIAKAKEHEKMPAGAKTDKPAM
jgi:cytochrome c-type biogenesis protein CcmH/NrfG